MNSSFYHCLRYVHQFQTFVRQHYTPLGLGVLACIPISAMIGIDTTQSLAYLVFTFSVALMLLAILASRWIRLSFRASRDLPPFGTVAEPLNYRVRLYNSSAICQKSLQLQEDFANHFPQSPDYQRILRRYKTGRERRQRWREQVAQSQWAIASPIRLPDLPAHAETEVTGSVVPLRRGRLCFEAITLACPDPLGLVYRRVTQGLPQTVTILPRRYQLPKLELRTRRHRQAGGLQMSSSVGASSEFMALREYRSGDPSRQIHWKSTAKLGKPMVKESPEECGVRHGLILDTFQAEPYSEFFEEAIAVASSLIRDWHSRQAPLDLMFYAQEGQCFSGGQNEYALQVLAGLQPCQTESFEAMMPFLHRRLGQLSSVICIFLTWDQSRHALLRRMIHAGIPSKTLLFSDGSFRPDASLTHDLTPECQIHFLRRGHVQADLMRL